MKTKIFEYFKISLGTFLIAFAVNVFLLPQKLSSGGIGSIGTVLVYLFNIPISVTNIILNAILFVLGYRYLPKQSLVKTVFGIVMFTLFLEITTYISPYTDDLLISALAGGLFIGLGVGIVIKEEASTGGSDLAGLMLHKVFAHIAIPSIIFVIDSVIIAFSGVVFKSVTVTFYSAIVLFVAAKVSDIVLFIGDKAKLVFVISDNCDKISTCIMQKFNRGATGIYSKGMYYDKDKLTLFCVLSPRETPKLVKEIKTIDENAFVVITDAREVIGEGFKNAV